MKLIYLIPRVFFLPWTFLNFLAYSEQNNAANQELLENINVKTEIETVNPEGIIVKKKYKRPTIKKFSPYFDINRDIGKKKHALKNMTSSF